MEQYSGKTINKKIAIGRIHFLEKQQSIVKRRRITDLNGEIERFKEAVKTAQEQLYLLGQKAKKEVGEAESEIFDVHAMMLDDVDYTDSVCNIIMRQEMCAEYAVAVTGDNFAAMFAAMDDSYMKARAADVKDISERVVGILSGNQDTVEKMEEPVILVAMDLAPSETVQMDKSKLLGFVTEFGSRKCWLMPNRRLRKSYENRSF